MFLQNQVTQICDIAKEAGDVLLKYYRDYKSLDTVTKSDDSPVTKADLAANEFIIEKLQKLFPEIAIVSEENSERENLFAAKSDQFFMIDPLDGTSGFVKKSDEFSVNIALIKDGRAVFGVIYMPVQDIMYFTSHDKKAYKVENFSKENKKLTQIKVSNPKQGDALIVICTKRDPEKSEIIHELKEKGVLIKELLHISSSYKFCLIAEGKADLYPRRASIKAWDIAAGHAIVKFAGGLLSDLSEKEVLYNFDENFNVPFFNTYAS